jgi:putative phage-type endonuclease
MIEQGSIEWFQQRAGKATASRIADIIAKTKSGPSASRKNYAAQLVAERLTGTVEQSYTNAAMQWGTEKEPDARAAYAFLHADGMDVTTAEFVVHPAIADAGASPDGYVGTDGLVEIKAPNTATHIETLLGKTVPSKYVTQMMWQMACTGRAWCDFVSFDPRLPDHLSLFVQRVNRNDVMIGDLEREVEAFLAEVSATMKALEAYAEAA